MNLKKIVGKTTEYIFCGITAVQVLLGLIWAFCQFPHMQNWQETYEYLDISRTWVMDEYVSFLYPVLIRICTGIEKLAGIPFYVPVYVIQLAAAIFASAYFAKNVLHLDKARTVWASSYLVTFPMLLQFHMSVRVESLCVSGMLLLVALLKVKKRELVCCISAFLITLSLIWLLPDMVLLCGVVWVCFFVESLIKTRKKDAEWNAKKFALRAGTFALALFIGLSVNSLVQTPGSRGRIQKTFWAAAFQRVVTDYFSRSYAMWDDAVRTAYTIEEAMELANRSDNMMYSVGPKLEADWGKERANELYKQMTLDCFRVRTRTVVYQIRDDLFDSLLMPFSVWWQDEEARMSQTGWNYERLREPAPEVTSAFVIFSTSALVVLCVCGILGFVIKRNVIVCGFYFVGLAFGQCIQSVLSTGNRVNYSILLFVILFWCYLAVVNLNLEKHKE